MPAVHRILARSNNAATAAIVSASSVLPASNSVFRQTTDRDGNGQVRLAGSYTGEDDTTIEIEIRPASTGAERVSSPVFAGAGNGAMSGETAGSGVAAQDLTVTLVDLGTATAPAQAILYADVLLYAKTAGTGGNSIELGLAVNLTRGSPPVGVLPADLKQGEREWSTQTMNFGAKPLNPDGTLPSDAPRLIFGGDTSQVYRHYKRWDGTEWQYGFSPTLAANYPKGALVEGVTGDYTATVTQSATVETYPGLVTLYDLLLALDASTLVTVSSPPANDQKPGGMAAVDMPFRASAFALPVVKGREGLPDLAGIVVATTAPTETVTVECIDATVIGGETWEVRSAVAGTLPKAVTGVAYTAGFVGFTIPVQELEEYPVTGRISITNFQWADRAQGGGEG